MPAVVPYGCHEGSRSEYLAQYVFASWGTAVVIPHQEDHGIDLTCTLMERVGKLYLARCPYTVQVKSSLDPLVFEGEEVEWVVRHPLPLYLCIVNKAEAHISIYHTFPRFATWSLGELPDRLVMTPAPATPGVVGRVHHCSLDYSFSLDQPILDFTLPQMLDNAFWANARRVFQHWVDMENDNLTRIRAGLLKCRMPGEYRTNETWVGGWTELWLTLAGDDHLARSNNHLKECLEWVGGQMEVRSYRRCGPEGWWPGPWVVNAARAGDVSALRGRVAPARSAGCVRPVTAHPGSSCRGSSRPSEAGRGIDRPIESSRITPHNRRCTRAAVSTSVVLIKSRRDSLGVAQTTSVAADGTRQV